MRTYPFTRHATLFTASIVLSALLSGATAHAASAATQSQSPPSPVPVPTPSPLPIPADADAAYVGWNGQVVPLHLATDRVGITFEKGLSSDDIRSILAQDSSINYASAKVAMKYATLERRRTLIVDTVEGTTSVDVERILDSMRQKAGVVTVNPVVYPHGDDTRPSLVTNMLYVTLSVQTPEKDLLALFESDGLEVVSRNDYSEIGVIGFRVKLSSKSGAKALTGGANTLEIAERYRNHPLMLEAVPTFAPLYSVQTSLANPNDALYGAADPPNTDPQDAATPSSTHGQWEFVRMRMKEAWDTVYYGSYDNVNTAPRIVIAAMDDGVFLNYNDWTTGSGGSNTLYNIPSIESIGIADVYALGTRSIVELNGHMDFDEYNSAGIVIHTNQWINEEELASPGTNADGNGKSYDFFGWDFVGSNPISGDDSDTRGDFVPYPDAQENPIFSTWHGSGAAAQAGARTNNSVLSVTKGGLAGVCPSALVMPIRYHNNVGANANGDCDAFYFGHAEAAINYAAKTGKRPTVAATYSSYRGAQVLMLCMAVNTYDPGLYNAIRMARSRGCIVVCAVGNWDNYPPNAARPNSNIDVIPSFPVVWPEVLSVGASAYPTTDSPVPSESGENKPEKKAFYSAYGWAMDVLAPSPNFVNPPTHGTPPYTEYTMGLLGQDDQLFPGDTRLRRYRGGDIYGGGGTSGAFPQVAGLAALVLTANPSLSAAEVHAIISFSARDLYFDSNHDGTINTTTDTCGPTGYGGRDLYTGWGRVDAKKAVDLARKGRFAVKNPMGVTIASWDNDGRFVMDGVVKENALLGDSAALTPTSDSEFIVQSGSTVVARLVTTWSVPSDASNPASYTPPTLYLKGSIQTTWVDPSSSSSEFIIQNSAGGAHQVVSYINSLGNLYVRPVSYCTCKDTLDSSAPTGSRQEIFITSRAHSRGVFSISSTDPDAIQDAIDNTAGIPDNSILEVAPGTYNAINFNGRNLVIRSRYLGDTTATAQTIIGGNNAGPAVTFRGTESDNASIQGFTIQGGRAASGGGILGKSAGYTTNTRASILNNVITDNAATGTVDDAGGGAIAFCNGVIEGNQIGKSATSFNRSAKHGGAFNACHGVIRWNKIVYNRADYSVAGNSTGTGEGGAFYRCNTVDLVSGENNQEYIYGEINQNYIAHNEAANGGAFSQCSTWIHNNIIYLNRANHINGVSSSGYGGAFYNCVSEIPAPSPPNPPAYYPSIGIDADNNSIEINGYINNNTIYGNIADISGGGLYGCQAEGEPFMDNIVWANSPNASQIANCAFRFVLNCCVENGYAGGVFNRFSIATSPAFVGGTPNEATQPWYEFLHLTDSSPCKDTGYGFNAELPGDETIWRNTDGTQTMVVLPSTKTYDFDHQAGPILGDNADYEGIREIGADEYPTYSTGAYSYWWQRFGLYPGV